MRATQYAFRDIREAAPKQCPVHAVQSQHSTTIIEVRSSPTASIRIMCFTGQRIGRPTNDRLGGTGSTYPVQTPQPGIDAGTPRGQGRVVCVCVCACVCQQATVRTVRLYHSCGTHTKNAAHKKDTRKGLKTEHASAGKPEKLCANSGSGEPVSNGTNKKQQKSRA